MYLPNVFQRDCISLHHHHNVIICWLHCSLNYFLVITKHFPICLLDKHGVLIHCLVTSLSQLSAGALIVSYMNFFFFFFLYEFLCNIHFMFIAWIIFYNISQSVISPQSFSSTKSFTFLYTYNLWIFHNFHYFL